MNQNHSHAARNVTLALGAAAALLAAPARAGDDPDRAVAPAQTTATKEASLSADYRAVADGFFVSPQISIADVAEAASRGVTLIINNRPDGEMIGQPTSDEIEAAASAAGVAYAHIPVDQRGITPEHLDAFDRAMSNRAAGETLAYCRSGTRSIILRSYASARAGKPFDEIVSEAAAAGYDISGHRPALDALAAARDRG
ncbi:MAG: TIGR01244 family sulfur transferase, partial [Hyphococcus sp.]